MQIRITSRISQNDLLLLSQSNVLRKKFNLIKVIGQGSFAKVIQIQHKQTKQYYAAKIIDVPIDADLQAIKRQFNILKRVNSDHIVTYVDQPLYDQQNKQLIIFMKLSDANLKKYSKIKLQWTYEDLLNLMIQVVSAFLKISSLRIAHRDLKPENILVNENGCYQICDFGCSSASNTSIMSFGDRDFGTSTYILPQMLGSVDRSVYITDFDVWSFGVILYQLIYKKHPLSNSNSKQFDFSIARSFYKGQIQIAFPEFQGNIQKIIPIIKKMLNRSIKITWRQLKEQLLNLPHHNQIYHKNVQGIEFQNINEVFYKFSLHCTILANIVELIRINLEDNIYSFWKDNQIILQQFNESLHDCLYFYLKKFKAIFSYKLFLLTSENQYYFRKIERSIENVFNDSGRQRFSVFNPQKSEKILKNSCLHLLKELKIQSNGYKSINILQDFCEQIAQQDESQTMFCRPSKFIKSIKNFKIQQQIINH